MKQTKQNLNRRWLSFLHCTMLMLFIATASFAQENKITGIVNDAATGEPLIAASVVVDGTDIIAMTDIDGSFTIENAPASGTLTFSYIGYINQSIGIVNGKNYIIALQEDLQLLDEVVVVGYEVKKKSVVTGAIGSVDADELQQAKPANAVSALSGRVSGVNILASSGNPGSTPDVVIRGVGTNGNSSPLYVVDGLQMNNMDDINPNDIASIEVLKDATSTAIYGARGANGVILVTTKKGSSGRTTLSYNGYYGISNAYNVTDMMNADEYVYMINNFWNTNGVSVPEGVLAEKNGVDTNWLDQIINTANTQEHNVSFSTASDKGASLVSIGYLNQNGIIGGDKSGFKRITARLNSDYNINDYIHVGTNINVSYREKSTMSTLTNAYNPIRYAINIDPLALPYDSVNGDEQGFGYSTSSGSALINPLAFINGQPVATNSTKVLNGNVFAEIKPIKNLVIRTDIGASINNGYNRSYSAPYYHTSEYYNTNSTVSNSAIKSIGWQWENTIKYKFNIKEHNFSLLGGMSALSSDWENFSASRNGVALEAIDNEGYRFLNAGDSATSINSGTATPRHSMQSFFGRVSYDYKERYMAEFVIRHDGSSNFGPNNKYGTFPGVSFGWNIHNEEFWNLENFNSLKLRASWGQNGNESISAFSYTSIIGNTYYTLGNGSVVTTGGAPTSLSNPNVKWETSEQLNIGVDMGFYGGKLTGSLDWYKKTTRDLLMQPTLSSVYGNNAPYYNVGQVSNSGLEFIASYRGGVGDFNYSVSLNGTLQNNNVDKVGNINGYLEGGYWLNLYNVTRMQEGYPMTYFRLYETDGIFNTQEEINNYVNEKGELIQPDAVPGDFKWKDTDGDGTITDEDRTNCGNPWAKWSFGTNISMDYKGFDLTMNMSAKTGFKVMSANIRPINYGYANLPTFFLDHWTPTNTQTDIPRLATNNYDTNGNLSKPSDFFLYDGDYFSINLLELGYSLPKKLINKALLSNFRVYVACDNLARFDKYPYMSTEIADMTNSKNILETGIDYGVYPVARTIRFGVSVAF